MLIEVSPRKTCDGSHFRQNMGVKLTMCFLLVIDLICFFSFFSLLSISQTAEAPFFIKEPPFLLEFTNETGISEVCLARGDPSPQVTWVSTDGIPLNDIQDLRQVFHNGTLTLLPFAATAYRPDIHSATYRCKASNHFGTLLSRDMKLRAVLLQRYDIQALPGSSLKGGIAVLRCLIPSSVKNDVNITAWIQDVTGFIVSPSLHGDGKYHMLTSGELFIYGVDKSDQYNSFRCRAQHRFSPLSQMSSNSASVTVTEPLSVIAPSIAGKIATVYAEMNKNVTIPCLVQGFPTPEIKWYRLDTNEPTSMEDFTASFGVLVLENLQNEDAGTYRCTASNSVGQAHYDVRLEVMSSLTVELLPKDVAVDQNQSITLRCSFSSPSQVTIKWFKDGIPMNHRDKYQHIGRDSLRINNMAKVDEGVYQCFVSNDREMVQASSRLLLGDAEPQLIHTSNEQTLVPGPFVTFKCVAIGNPRPDITWALDSYPLSNSDRISQNQFISANGEVTSYLNISSVHVEDGGEYTCIANNKAGQVKHSSKLNVYGLPYIRPMPKITAVSDTDVAIKCPAAGYPLSEIVWLKGEELIRDSAKYTVNHQGGLTIHGINKATDAGVYTCIAKDRQGHSGRRDVPVDVVVAPKVTPFQMDPTLRLGERLTLTCAITKGDLPLTINWKINGQLVSSPEVKIMQINSFTSILIIDSLQLSHSGNYACVVRNAAAQVSQSQPVVIQVPPYWLVEPNDVNVLRGHPSSIHCKADGYPAPNITWVRLLGPNFQDSVLLTNQTLGIKVYDNGTLHIRSASKTTHGRYMCRALNKVGQDLTKAITVTVNAGPRFRETLSRLSVKRDSTASLPCLVEGDSPLHLAWRKSSSSTSLLSANYRLRIQEKETPNGMISTLTIQNVQVEDDGIYICIASNAHGQLERDIRLIVQEPPGMARHTQIQETSSRRISLSWLPPLTNNLNPIIAYVIQYKEITRGTWQETESLPGYITSYTAEGLQPSTSYQFRVIAETSAGRGPPSDVIHVATHGEPPGAAPNDFRALPTSSTSIRLMWSALGKSYWHSNLIGYHVGFREESANSYNFSTIPLTNYHATMEFLLTNLRKFTKYIAVVRAFNRYGEGSLSQPVTSATLEDVPSASPTSVRCTSVASQSIQVTWQPPPPSEHNGILQNYRIFYEPLSPQYDSFGLQSKTTEGLFVTLTGLQPWTAYRIRVEALTRMGNGPLSPFVTCKTEEAVPGPPADIKAYSTGLGTITVCWSPPLQPNGEIIHYTLNVKSGGHSSSNIIRHNVVGTQTFDQVESLNVHQFYEIWVTATTRAGDGEKSKVLRHSLSFKATTAICSFGRQISLPWRSKTSFACHTVGNTPTGWSWNFNSKTILQNTMEEKKHPDLVPKYRLENTSHLIVNDFKKDDAGNYTCTVRSGAFVDSISYRVIVMVPPSIPVIQVMQTNQYKIQLQWKVEDHGGTAIRGYLIHWRREGGDWEERELDRSSTSTQLENLQCGSRYQLYMTSHNAVGTSVPSNTVTARTKGDVPATPKLVSAALSVNSSHVVVFFGSWEERGCPVHSFSVEYKVDGDISWILVSSDISNLPAIFIEDLQPATAYNIRIIAHSSAGSVTAEYDFVTLDHGGLPPSPDRVNRAGRLLPSSDISTHIMLPWWLIASVSTVGTASLLGLGVACYCLYKTRNESQRLSSTLPSDSTIADTQTWPKGNAGFADRNSKVSGRGSTYELHTMEKIPSYSTENHDDIYPYATFELHREHKRSYSGGESSSPVKLREGPPDFLHMKYVRDARKNTLQSRPSPWSELSTIEIERHFEGSPTISDSDLELAIPPHMEPVLPQENQYSHRNQRKRCSSNISAKRFSMSKEEYSSSESSPSTEQNFRKHRYRPSHPLPKKLPLSRLADQSNLWSGDQCGPWRPRPELDPAKPKIKSANVPESPTDHSIAV